MVEVLGTVLGLGWYGIGLLGSIIFTSKGYSMSLASFLWGAMLGPIHLLIAMCVPER